jgi:hypothetical protein
MSPTERRILLDVIDGSDHLFGSIYLIKRGFETEERREYLERRSTGGAESPVDGL